LLSACADILDVPDQPVLVASQSAACVDAPAALRPARETAYVRLRTCNFVSTNCVEPVTGLSAKLCNKLDVECSEPVQDPLPEVGGELSFQAPTGGVLGLGFDGYIRLKSARAPCTDAAIFGPAATVACSLSPTCDPAKGGDSCRVPVFADSMVFFNPPIANDVPRPVQIPMIPTAATFSLLMAADARTADASTGFVFVNVLDCAGNPASGATVELTPPPNPLPAMLYLVDGVVSAGATATDASGVAGLLGVQAGFRRIVATRMGDSGLETGTVGVQVGPVQVTYVSVVLSPVQD
jgi:hypothetical protein